MVTHARTRTRAQGKGEKKEGEEGEFKMATVRNAFSLFTTMVTHAHAHMLAYVCTHTIAALYM